MADYQNRGGRGGRRDGRPDRGGYGGGGGRGGRFGGWGRDGRGGGGDRGRGGNARGGRGGHREEREIRPMGFKVLEGLARDEDDPAAILQRLNNTGFSLLIDSHSPLSPEFIANIVTAVAKALPYKAMPQSKLILLNSFRHSQLIKSQLNMFYIGMMSEDSPRKLGIHSRVTTGILEIFKEMLHHMPTSSDAIFGVLTIMETSAKSMQKSGTLTNEKFLTDIQNLIDLCNELRESRMQQPNVKEEERENREDFRPPPNDFRDMSVIPTPDDVQTTDRPFLRKNKESGSYIDLNHYLDVQFRLLREDFIRPLRDGICHYMKEITEGVKERNTDIRVYDNVQILYPICGSNGVCYRARFDTEKLKRVKWQYSKRLIYGSLLCLSNDRFQTLLFATVQNRDAKLLADGELDIRFEHDLAQMREILPEEIFTMAETTAYFEAYRHVLEGFKHIGNDFPFQQYLVEGKKKVDAPVYIRRNPDADFDLRRLCGKQKEEDSSNESGDSDSEEPIFRRRVRAQKDARWKNVHLLDERSWPPAGEMNVDETQYEAIKAALTKELAIIQGPPGTGKTYIGLKIVSALLANHNLWGDIQRPAELRNLLADLNLQALRRNRQQSPILVVCYTNHALDQFLEGISDFCQQGIVRVGGRSKCEAMKQYNMRTLRQEMRRRSAIPQPVFLGRRDAQSKMQNLASRMDQVSTQLASCEKGIIHEDILEQFMSEKHRDALAALYGTAWQHRGSKDHPQRPSMMVEWLGLGDMLTEEDIENQQQNQAAEDEDEDEFIEVEEDAQIAEANRQLDIDDDPRHLRQLQHNINVEAADRNLAFNIDQLNQDQPPPQGQQDEVWQIQSKARKKRNRKIKRYLQGTEMMTEDEERAVRNIWQLRVPERWKLYRYWLARYKNQLRQSIRDKEVEYQQTADRLRELLDEEDKAIMQTAKVLGMTTTGAAKYRNILQEVRPKIVIVEEAAEVLEAHIVTTLSEGCKHLILIGDHKQLRPNPTVYELAEKYKLKVSLFERLLNNGMACVTLGEQHRMRPEISRIMKHIYPNLQDHTSVMSYENIKGVSKNLFFLNHTFPEDKDEELKSKSNYHEARYISAFCRYLLLQGYEHSQITVLTAYTGQVFLLKKHMPKKIFEGIRISAIDNFQGEENDIIVVSLVRSNKENQAGFLKEDNRLCVALSRARQGLYVLGNFKLLEESSRLWLKVIQTVKDVGSFGNSIHLYCQNHPNDAGIQAGHSKDFQNVPEGGCQKPCEYRLKCGHSCARMCHSYDQDHENYKCLKVCGKKICHVEGHRCQRACSSSCGECKISMPKVIPNCGHIQNVPCSVPVERFVCRETCSKRLPECGHKCQNYCGEECTQQCRQDVQKTLSCGHTVPLKCYQNPEVVKCPEKCTAELECGDQCRGTCGRCFQGRIHQSCQNKCGRDLVCGHPCEVNCTRECPPCRRPCQNKCIHSECRQRCGVSCAPCKEPCAWQCRHKSCTKMCHEPCDRDRCNEPCRKQLPCNHPCIGLCGETCPNKCRICNGDEVTEIFFGTEDEPDARFVQLQECGHIFEVSGLDQWMETNQDVDNNDRINIQMKKCPKCSVVIRKNLRYGSIINQILCDIEAVKEKVQGLSGSRLKDRKKQVLQDNMYLAATEEKSFEIFESRLQSKHITYGEVECIAFSISVLRAIVKLKKRLTKKFSASALKTPTNVIERSAKQIDKELASLSAWTTQARLRFSEQEQNEARQEIERISFFLDTTLISYQIQKTSIKLPVDACIERDEALDILRSGKTLKEADVAKVKSAIKTLSKHGPMAGLGISEEERKMLVEWGKSVGLSQGHWYKCPNGHVYAIGECGGANQGGKCPECKADIGGRNHALAAGNQVASEMAGARFAAWSEEANMANYDLRHLQFD